LLINFMNIFKSNNEFQKFHLTAFSIVKSIDTNVNDIVGIHLQKRNKVPHSIFATRLIMKFEFDNCDEKFVSMQN
jgi:hypothetical protein